MPDNPTLEPLQDGVTKRPRGRRVSSLHKRQQLAGIERRKKVWELTLKGGSCRKIGDALGVSAMQVSRDLKRILDDEARTTGKSVAAYRTLEEARLDDLQVHLGTAVVNGDVTAIREARKIGESRRRLFGIDAPVATKVEHSGVNGGPIETRSAVALLSMEDIVERMKQAQAVLTQTALPDASTDAVKPAEEKAVSATEAYEAVMKARANNGGNDNGHNGGG